MNFKVINCDTETSHLLTADSFLQATISVYTKEYGRKKNVVAMRVTGTDRGSGVFQVYIWNRANKDLHNVGPNRGYHLRVRYLDD